MKYTLSHIQAAYNLGKRIGMEEMCGIWGLTQRKDIVDEEERKRSIDWYEGLIKIKLKELEDRIWWNPCYRKRLDLFMEKLEEAALIKNKNEVFAEVLKYRANQKKVAPQDD